MGRCLLSLCNREKGECLRQKMTFEDARRFTVSGATPELFVIILEKCTFPVGATASYLFPSLSS